MEFRGFWNLHDTPEGFAFFALVGGIFKGAAHAPVPRYRG